MNNAGAMRIGGEMGMDQAGAYDIGGAMPKKVRSFLENMDDADHSKLYHQILNFTPHEWEAVRESAHQLMGGAASPMWGEIERSGGAMDIGGGDDEPSYSDLRDVLMTPSRGGAARLLELENDVHGSGFKKALKKAVKHTGKILKGSKRHLQTLNEVAAEVGDMGGPVGDYAKTVHSYTNPTLENVNKAEKIAKAVKDAKPSDMGNTRENIRTGVQIANAALTGDSAKERATNVKNVVKSKVEEKYGSGMDVGGAEEEMAGRMMSEEAGAMDIGGAMEVGAGNMGIEEKKKKKKAGKIRKLHPPRKPRKQSPEPLPLEKASKDVQEAVATDYHKGRKLHDPRKRR